jgi:hypothetical protein
MSKDEHGRPRRHFRDYDPMENFDGNLDGDNPLGHYDDYHDFDGSEFGPYRPLHPWREAITISLFVLGIGYGLWWVGSRIF